MTVLRCAGILLPQLLIVLFWTGSHDLLGGWNQTDDAMLTLLVLFILTPITTLTLLVAEIVKAFKKQGTASQKTVRLILATALFIEALAVDFYLLTQVRM
jgi:hypothetical protein